MKIHQQYRILKLVFSLFFSLGILFSHAQVASKLDSIDFTVELKLSISVKILNCDKLGNIYVLDEADRFSKYNSSGLLLSTLNYNYSGSISSIDVSNPMEIFLFYKELNMLIILDNNLAFRGKISLQDWGITQASCIARSYENGLWVFDSGDLQLKKFTREGKLLQSSGNAIDIAGNDKFNPIKCIDNGNRVLLIDSVNGLFLFDVFAGFIKKIPITNLKSVQLLESEIFFIQANELVTYNLQNSSRSSLLLPFPNILSGIKVKQGRFIFTTSQSILITNMAK